MKPDAARTIRAATPDVSIPSIDDYHVRPPDPERLTGGKRAAGGISLTRPGLVSLITVSFNAVRTIERTIDSIKAQTYRPLEYLVIDGGSRDGTVDLLRRRGDDIDLWISEADSGISDAFNKGIALANGEYVAIINSDDWLDADHVATGVEHLQRLRADFVFGDLMLHAPGGELVHFFAGDPNYAKRIAHWMPHINHPSVICRRDAFERTGLFDPSLRIAMDYDWFLRLHKLGGAGSYVPQLKTHMSLDGRSDRDFASALRETRLISIRHGYPRWLAWSRYGVRIAKGKVRRLIQPWLPSAAYQALRRLINVNYRNARSDALPRR